MKAHLQSEKCQCGSTNLVESHPLVITKNNTFVFGFLCKQCGTETKYAGYAERKHDYKCQN